MNWVCLAERDRPLVQSHDDGHGGQRWKAFMHQHKWLFAIHVRSRRARQDAALLSTTRNMQASQALPSMMRRTGIKANPGLAVGIKSLTGFRAQAEAAMLTPADQNGFRALALSTNG